MRPVVYSTFCKYWAQLVPYIVVSKPRSDLCWVCHQNTTAIMKLANKPDEEKAKVNLLLRNKCCTAQNIKVEIFLTSYKYELTNL